MNITPEMLAKVCDPKKMAEEICSVQPMDSKIIADLKNDPLANTMLNNFMRRNSHVD